MKKRKRGLLFKKYLLQLPLFSLVRLNKIFFATVVGTFNCIRKETRGEFISALVIAKTFATDSFPTTWITTITRYFVFLYFTFYHNYGAPTNFLNSLSLIITNPSFFAFSYFEPGFIPTTT